MREPIVLTDKEYFKGKAIFDQNADRFNWIISEPEESKVASSVKSSGSRIAVLGVEKYTDSLYEALAANAKGQPALIARHGVGYEGIDLAQCRKNRIILTITKNAPDKSVAEHTIALLLGLTKNIVCCDTAMRAGRFMPMRGIELSSKILGIAGFGNIGKETAVIASKGFGMKVVAFGIHTKEEIEKKENCTFIDYKHQLGISEYYNDFKTFADAVNIISVHMPLRADTIKYFNKDRFALFKEDSFFINTSRGKLVDEIDLYDALSSGRLKGAALDVYENEPYIPAAQDKDLRTLQNIILTSHIASDTDESNRNMQMNIIMNIDLYLARKLDGLTAIFRP